MYFLTLCWFANNSNMLENHQVVLKPLVSWKHWPQFTQLFFFVFLQRKSPEGTLKKIEFYLGKNTVLDNLLLKKKASPSPYLEWRRLTLESIKVEFFWKSHKIWKKKILMLPCSVALGILSYCIFNIEWSSNWNQEWTLKV